MFPQSSNESIPTTTWTKEFALKLVEESNIIMVKQMEYVHTLALFEKKLGIHKDGDYIGELATVLEYTPLAIVGNLRTLFLISVYPI
jgi:hypothetical protein